MLIFQPALLREPVPLSFWSSLSRSYITASVLRQVLTRLRCVRDVLTPCAARMILLTSSSIPSSAMSNAGGREWAKMGGILHGVVHGAWQIFRFQSPSETKLIKNCRLPSWFKKHASWFRKRVSWYMTWNTWELKVNSTILTHSKSKLMLILSILIVNWWVWIIKLHLWYFVPFGVA